MGRAELEEMTLASLQTLATEQGIEGGRGLSRKQLIEALASQAAAAPAATSDPRKAAARPTALGLDVPSSTVHPQRAMPNAPSAGSSSHARPRPEPPVARAGAQTARATPNPTGPSTEPASAEPRTEATRAQPAPEPPRAEPRPSLESEPRHREPIGMLDLEELPETYGVDECEVIDKDPSWVFAYWEVTEAGLAAARTQLGANASSARLVLRLFTVSDQTGGEREVKDVDLSWNHGRMYLEATRAGAQLRVAVGLLTQEGYFAPVAHSSMVRIPPIGPSKGGTVEWMEVAPARTRGVEREPIVIVTRGGGYVERGIPAHWEEGRYHHPGSRVPPPPIDLTQSRSSSPWRFRPSPDEPGGGE